MGRLPKMCHCGQPLHYADETHRRAVEAEIAKHGEFITMWGPDDRRWKVPRHYFATHRPFELGELATLGFEEVV